MFNHLYRNTRLLILVILLILVWGLSSLQTLPRMEDPALSEWSGKITTNFPGASAERVESSVTEKLEQKLQEIKEVSLIVSTSQIGTSLINIKLQDTVINHDEVWSRVRDHLADITPQLPPGATAPKYEDINEGRAYTLIVGLTWERDSSPNYAILNRLAEELKQQLYNLGGVEKIEFWGSPSEEILVEINPTNLTALGLTPQQLSEQIRLSDAKVSAGRLHTKQNNLLIEVQSELNSLERIRQIPIHIGNNTQGLTRLGDIGLVKKTIQKPSNELAIINGKSAITLGVLIEPNRRTDQWMKNARQILEKFDSTISSGIGLEIVLDQNHYVETRLNNMFRSLLLGAILVTISTTLLMGVKSAIIIAFSLPLSVLMVFGCMNVWEIPLHQMSLTGLVIALGMLIDNPIVVLDEIENLLTDGYSPYKAISLAVSFLTIPLLASTLTSILTFLPIALLPGNVGEFVRTIGLSVILSLMCSLILSLTVIPAIKGKTYCKKVKSNKSLFWTWKGFSNSSLTQFYRLVLAYILATPIWGIALSLILPLTGFMMADSIPRQFFPPAERDQFQIKLELHSSASMEETQSIVKTASNLIIRHREISDLSWFIGTYPPAFYSTVPRGGIKGGRANYATAMVQIDSDISSHSSQIIQTLQRELNQAYPQALILVKQLEQSVDVPPIELRFYGSDLESLSQLGDLARSQLVQIPNVIHTRASFGSSLPKLALFLDEEKAQRAGLDFTHISRQLNTKLEGSVGGSILENTEELPVRIRLSNRDRANLDEIATLDLVPRNQLSLENPVSIPLSALGQFNLIPETTAITRRNGQRVNVVQGFIKAGVLPSKVLTDYQQLLAKTNFQLPANYSMEWGGESAESNDAIGNLLSTVGVIFVLMVAILVLSFNSFRSAGIIFCVAISSVGLALVSLKLFGYSRGFVSILGTVGLIGVAVNDSIAVLAAIHKDSLARKGDRTAMVKVIIRSTRHVLTTTITTVVGFIPIFIDGGELWPPLAICIVGGVMGSTLLAIFFVPCAYLILMGRNHISGTGSVEFNAIMLTKRVKQIIRQVKQRSLAK